MGEGLQAAQQAYLEGYAAGVTASVLKIEVPCAYPVSREGGSLYYWWTIGYADGQADRSATPPIDDGADDEAENEFDDEADEGNTHGRSSS